MTEDQREQHREERKKLTSDQVKGHCYLSFYNITSKRFLQEILKITIEEFGWESNEQSDNSREVNQGRLLTIGMNMEVSFSRVQKKGEK